MLGIKVKEVMRSYVVTGRKEETIYEIAKKMKDEDVGSVIIIENLKPIGIVTREDIVVKIVAEERDPKKEKAENIMSQPLVFCSKDDDILDAARIMNKYGYERLPVVNENGKLVGIISIREILAIAPNIIEIFKERLEEKLQEFKEEEIISGYCEICGNYSDELRNVNGIWICPECIEKEGYEI